MELDKQILQQKDKEVKENIDISLEMINNIVVPESQHLTELMQKIYTEIICVEEASIDTIEHYFLELSNAVYFITDRVEQMGLCDSISKISAREAYNKAYMNPDLPKDKPTVAELTAFAEETSKYEGVTNEIYNKAYKILKAKIEAAETMISSLSKVLSRRMQEAQMSSLQPATSRQILNEDRSF